MIWLFFAVIMNLHVCTSGFWTEILAEHWCKKRKMTCQIPVRVTEKKQQKKH